MNISKVSFSIPATSANLGPGFDSFGIALQIHNVVTLQKESRPIQHTSMIFQAAALFFANTGITPFNFSVEVEGDVPSARGLGSSVTVRLGILLGLNELAQRPLTSSALYHLAVELEGHSDNAAPALFGGFTIARNRREPVSYQLARKLCFILLIPDFEVSTASARKLLPASIPMDAAAANIANAAVVATAFATGNYAMLRGAFQDRLHQPFREPLIPYLSEALVAAESVGALGGWLSGSGSTIAAIAENETIAQCVVEVFNEIAPLESQAFITHVDNHGARLLN